MNTFCPLIKETCKQDECIAWKNSQCVIVAFLDLEIRDLSGFAETEINHLKNQIDALKKPDILPLEIETISHEVLAKEIVFLAKQVFSYNNDEYFSIPSELSAYYWSKKGIMEKFKLPPAIKLKIEQAERLAALIIEKERADFENLRREKEDNDDNSS